MRKLALGPSRRAGAFVLLPIELMTIDGSASGGFPHVYGTKRLHGLIVERGGTRHALDEHGNVISLAELLAAAPAIRETLED